MGWSLALGGFLLGAVPWGYLMGRAAGVDVRRAGSGNIGTANVLRTVGPAAALVTLALDAAKGAAPVLLGRWAALEPGAMMAIMAAPVLGHVYSPFLRFRGGKGVATALGVLVAANPSVALAMVAVWGAVAAAFRFSSLAAAVASAVLPLLAWRLDGRAPFVGVTAALAALVIWRHRANLRRLWQGMEPRIGQRAGAGAGHAPSGLPSS